MIGESFIQIILECILFWAKWFAIDETGNNTPLSPKSPSYYLKTYKYLIS